jgi:hypothetical protein
MADSTLYHVWVQTGDADNLAGTDSNVFIQLFGSEGYIDPLHLPPQDIFAFENGQTDKFVLQIPDLGNLTRCCLGHDASADSGCYVVDVKIQNDTSKQTWLFTFNAWLGIEESGALSACADA